MNPNLFRTGMALVVAIVSALALEVVPPAPTLSAGDPESPATPPAALSGEVRTRGGDPQAMYQLRKKGYQQATVTNRVKKPAPPEFDNNFLLIARLDTNTWPWNDPNWNNHPIYHGDQHAWWDDRINHHPDCLGKKRNPAAQQQYRDEYGHNPDCLAHLTVLADTADFDANARVRLLFLHGNNPAIPPDMKDSLRRSLINFKYWVDEPKTNNPKGEMAFWSENHQICFATAEYLAGQLFPNDVFRDGQIEKNPAKTGAYHKERAHNRVLRWLNDRLRFGLNEWNSPGYYEYDIVPLLNLIDFADDLEIQRRASMVLDLLIFDLARYTQKGSFAVTAGRAYGDHKLTGWEQSVGDTVEMLFGTRGLWIGNDSPSAQFLASSRRYAVPTALLAIGIDQPSYSIDRSRVSLNFEEAEDYGIGFDNFEDIMFWWSHGAYLTKYTIRTSLDMIRAYNIGTNEDFKDIMLALSIVVPALKLVGDPTSLEAKADLLSVVTEGMSLTRGNLYTYRNGDVMLSSVQNFRKGQISPQLNAWQATFDNDVAVFTTYPAASSSHNGPNWWTGNAVNPRIVQYKDAAIIAYAPDPVSLQAVQYGSRTHAWFPFLARPDNGPGAIPGFESAGPGHFDQTAEQRVQKANVDGVWYFGRRNNGYIGIFSAQHDCAWTRDGDWAGKEIMCPGLRNIFIVQVGNKRQWDEGGRLDTTAAFGKFVRALTQSRIHIGDAVRNPVLTLGDVQASWDIPDSNAPLPPPDQVSKALHRLELHYDQQYPRLDGQPYCDDEFPRFENAYIAHAPDKAVGTVAWGQRQYTIQLGPYTLFHDLDQGTRVVDGTVMP